MSVVEGYILFVLQGLTVTAIVGGLGLWLFSRRRLAPDELDGVIAVRRLDDDLRDQARLLRRASMERGARQIAAKAESARDKERANAAKAKAKALARSTGKAAATASSTAGADGVAAATSDDQGTATVFVVDFVGDIGARQVAALRNELNAILCAARAGDEVLVRLESPGGAVHGYGLAGAQLARLRAANVRLTVAVDKVAASGGYMMAVVADEIVAAPFAMVGSIGVVATLPNVHRLLDKLDVDVELHTAGKHKRTLTVLGANTDEGRAKFREELEEIHGSFKAWIARHRPHVDLDVVATGEAWLGERGKELGLVDAIATSDDWLLQRRDRPLLHVRWQARRGVGERFGLALRAAVEGVVDGVLSRLQAPRP